MYLCIIVLIYSKIIPKQKFTCSIIANPYVINTLILLVLVKIWFLSLFVT